MLQYNLVSIVWSRSNYFLLLNNFMLFCWLKSWGSHSLNLLNVIFRIDIIFLSTMHSLLWLGLRYNNHFVSGIKLRFNWFFIKINRLFWISQNWFDFLSLYCLVLCNHLVWNIQRFYNFIIYNHRTNCLICDLPILNNCGTSIWFFLIFKIKYRFLCLRFLFFFLFNYFK